MHYQSRLFATDARGGFVLVVCHSNVSFGGEDTRETGCARVMTAHADALADGREFGPQIFPPRPASRVEKQALQRSADNQIALARSGAYDRFRSAEYERNAKDYAHAARLAGQPGVRIPRHVCANASGQLLLGYPPKLGHSREPDLDGLMQWFDLHSEESGRWRSARMPADPPGNGLDAYGAAVLGRPLALSSDGSRVLLSQARLRDGQEQTTLVECGLKADLPKLRSLPNTRYSTHLAAAAGWHLLREGEWWLWPEGALRPRLVTTLPQEKHVQVRPALLAHDGGTLILPSLDSAAVLLISAGSGAQRLFRPHRGAQRGARAKAAVSPDGLWLVSLCCDQLVATNLLEGRSWVLRELPLHVDEHLSYDGFLLRSVVPPTFAFIGDSLLVFDGEHVRRQSLEVPSGVEPFVSEAGRPGARKRVNVDGPMDLPALLGAAELTEFIDSIAPRYRTGVQLRTRKLGKAGWRPAFVPGAPALGGSRLGGWPDLGADAEWPTWQDRPMAFLGQINLAEAHQAMTGLALPRNGLLSFFMGCQASTYSKTGDDRMRYLVDLTIGSAETGCDGLRVLYQPDPQNLRRAEWRESPLPELFDPAGVEFRGSAAALPDEDTVAYVLLPLDPAARDHYNGLLDALRKTSERHGDQLLGYPQVLQSTPLELLCEQLSRGESPWRFPDFTKVEHRAFAEAAAEWVLLLQLTSNDDADMNWGDAGMLYVYVRREALARGDFSEARVCFDG